MDLLNYITGGSPNDDQATGPSFIDRFINPMTMAGLAMVGGKDPMAAANFADQMQQRRQSRQMASFLVGNAPPEERAMALLAPSQYVAAKMGRMMQKPFAVGDDQQVYDPSSGQWMSPPGSQGSKWTVDKMRKEYDYSERTPESVKAAEDALDPSLLVFDPKSPKIQAKKVDIFNTARQDIEKQLLPIRAGMQGIQSAKALMNIKGGAADYGVIIGFVKSLDPTSVVRESEADSAVRAAGFVSTINSIAEKMKAQGGMLGAEQKAQLNDAINGLSQMFANKYSDIVNYANNYSKEFDLNPDLLIGPKINFPDQNIKNVQSTSIAEEAPGFIDRVKEAVVGTNNNSMSPPTNAVPDSPIRVQAKQGGGFEYSYDGGRTWGPRK